jgi:hypothetical protein
MEGGARDLIDALSRHLPEGNEDRHEKSETRQPVSRSRFEPSTSHRNANSIEVKRCRMEGRL